MQVDVKLHGGGNSTCCCFSCMSRGLFLLQISEDYLSEPMTIEYPTDDGQTAFMNYYAPKNQDYQLPPGETPPLLVKIHGGPTSQASTAFNLGYQYWTSRGNLLSHNIDTCLITRHVAWPLAWLVADLVCSWSWGLAQYMHFLALSCNRASVIRHAVDELSML